MATSTKTNTAFPDFEAATDCFIAAAKTMRQDDWWWRNPAMTNQSIKRRILSETIAHRLGLPANPAVCYGRSR